MVFIYGTGAFPHVQAALEAVVHRTLPVLGVQYHPERQSFSLRRTEAADAAALFHWWAGLVMEKAELFGGGQQILAISARL